MAKMRLKSYIKSVHGRMGNVIHYNVYGYQYARSYSIPRNPRTEAQQNNRSAFAEAVKLWQELTPCEQSEYNRLAVGKPLSGYNIFISMQMKGMSLKLLKQVHRKQMKVKDISGRCTQADTSVSPPFWFLCGTSVCKKQASTMNNPPGIAAPAA